VSGVRVRIDQVAVELAEERRAAEVEQTLRMALALLGQRLANAPLGLGKDAPRRALELVEIGPISPEWLGGPGGAARLADELYQRIARAAA
jgi:hypothetical protein